MPVVYVVVFDGHGAYPRAFPGRQSLYFQFDAVNEQIARTGFLFGEVSAHDGERGDFTCLYRPHLLFQSERSGGVQRQPHEGGITRETGFDGAAQTGQKLADFAQSFGCERQGNSRLMEFPRISNPFVPALFPFFESSGRYIAILIFRGSCRRIPLRMRGEWSRCAADALPVPRQNSG